MNALLILLLPIFAFADSAYFAGGCFWCMEPPFEKIAGVSAVTSGFAGGKIENPEYMLVASGKTRHVEAVKVDYDPKLISYNDLLEIFWRQVDPTDEGGQFVDRGFQYSTAIFYQSEKEKSLAEASRDNLQKSGRFEKPIKTRIVPYTTFYAAEEYHQDYYKKSTLKYKYYRFRSGRDQYLDKTWGSEREYHPGAQKADLQSTSTTADSGVATSNKSPDDKSPEEKTMKYSKPSAEKIKEMLTPLQFKVTQEEGTERPFNNEYWDNKAEGIYVDIVSGEPLFSSTHKYKSGTGWPSFYQPIDKEFIVEKKDRKLFVTRTEVRSKFGDSHLGHVFSDGPQPTGLRYCINSASLKFIPKDQLKEAGYEQYLSLFEQK